MHKLFNAHSYMPNARLTDAHLIEVEASQVEFYGNDAALDGATLDGIVLTHANLGGLNLKSATLYNAQLNEASLINAKLNGAFLDGATLAYSHLQGADFTDVALNGVDISNAAVAVKEGVHLFDLVANDPNSKPVLAEFKAAAGHQFEITHDPGKIKPYTDDLDKGDLETLRLVFQRKGVKLSKAASTVTKEPGSAWQINDPSPGEAGAYTVFTGFTDLGDPALLARPSLPLLRQVFQDNEIALRWQAIVITAAPKQWGIDNDSENPKNTQLGYMKYQVIEGDDGTLSFYGQELRIERLAVQGKLEIRMVPCPPTILCKMGGDRQQQQCGPHGAGSQFGPDTICPNTRKLSTNQAEKTPWEQMLRAPKLPTPPTCVPSPYASCPPPSGKSSMIIR